MKGKLITYFLLLFVFLSLVSLNAFPELQASLTDRLYGDKQPLDNILIIAIDDQSIQKIGRWPWDRSVFAKILNHVKGAKAIGMDLSFFEPSGHDQALETMLSNMDNVVLAAEINDNILYTPIFSTKYGYVNLLTDSDGITRSLYSGIADNVKPFAFQIFEFAFDSKTQEGLFNINYADKSNSFRIISATDVYNAELDAINKIVLIGATAPNLHDNYFVPTSSGLAMSGVEIHANIIQNLILGNFLEKQSLLSKILSIIVVSLLSMFFLSRLRIYYTIPLVIIIAIIYIIISVQLFNHNTIIDLFYVPLALLVFTGAGIGINYLEEKKHSAYLTDAFGKYISKDLLGQIVNKKHQLKLGGAKRTITVFFSDIRGFTTISEKLDPEQLVRLLNEYLTEMTELILEHKGTVDKFIGDAIMAFWNAPLKDTNHALHAVQAAIAQIKALKELQLKWKKQGYPLIEIGCGINTGQAVIGNMGSESRFDYTAMGDSINLGSRLEGLTKVYGVDIIISETTYDRIRGQFPTRKLDAVKVKGKREPAIIYELCIKDNQEYNRQYEKALKIYFKQDFADAMREFEKAQQIQEHKSNTLFIARCKEYKKSPPDKGWDGAFVMKTK